MALGLIEETTSGGVDIVPIIKFSAQSGDFIKVTGEKDASGEWSKREEEIPTPFALAFDFDEIEVGYMSFEGGKPDFRLVKLGEPMPEKPTGDFKQGFRLRVASKQTGLCEFSHSAKTVVRCMNALHDQYLAGAKDNPGKVAIVEVSGTETVTVETGQSTLRFKTPKWAITKWIDRPEMMQGSASEEPVAAEPSPVAQPEPDDFF